MAINPGDIVRVSTDEGFHNEDGDLTDPDTVTLAWYVHSDDDPTVWTYTEAEPGDHIVKDEVGLYHADIPVAKAGVHHFTWAGEGGVNAVESGEFRAVSA